MTSGMGEQLTGDDIEIDELLASLIEAPSFPPGSPASSAETDELPACDLTDLADLTELPDAPEVAPAMPKGACGSSSSDDLPMAVDEETRRLRRMARNRRAAAVSRQRKKAHVEQLQSQLDALRAENDQLRQRLHENGLLCENVSDAGLLSENDAHNQHSPPQPYVQQPAVGMHPAGADCDDHELSRAAPPHASKRAKRAKRVDTAVAPRIC